MMNKKSIGYAAVCGFVLSFLIGIAAKNPLLSVFTRSLIFSAVFAALAFGVSFLFAKFLAENSKNNALEGENGLSDRESKQKSGDNVNIVISDDGLEDEEESPKFFVENNRQGISGEELHKYNSLEKQNPAPAEEASPAFVPAGIQDISAKTPEAERQDSTLTKDIPSNAGDSSNKVNVFSDGSTIDDVDELPEIEDLSDSVKNNLSGDIIKDSDFASSGGSGFGGNAFSGGAEPGSQNADIMAQAVRTLLEKDRH